MIADTRLVGAIALCTVASGCASVAQVTTLSDPRCHGAFSAALSRILAGQGESPQVAAQLAESATLSLQHRGLGPRPFLVASPSGADYSFFVERKDASCVVRLYARQKGFMTYSNDLTYIATQDVAPCRCAE